MELLAKMPSEVEGVDLQAEKENYHQIPDVTVGEWSLNRATAQVELDRELLSERLAAARSSHQDAIFVTTHGPESPILELGYPTHGHFVSCHAGVYMDMYLGVAQKLIDEHHPALEAMLERLIRYRLAFRREINTDDYLTLAEGIEGVHLPQDLAALFNRLFEERFGHHTKTFLSNSGTEAVEAGLKLSQRVAYGRFVEKYGFEVLEQVMKQLDIPLKCSMEVDYTRDTPVYADYPFFAFAYKGAFHGRTMGSLSLTQSKKVHQFGYSKLRWVKHLTYNSDPQELAELIDPRPITQILAAEGGLKKVIHEDGRVPADLAALVIAEPMQGEGGYRPGDPEYFRGISEITQQHDILLMFDEVQTFARSGRLFLSEHFGVKPDIICTAKGAVVGITMARADLEKHLEGGWHSNTWGGGKVIEVNQAYVTVDTLLNYQDPVFDGRTLLENSRFKGHYLTTVLDRLCERHPDVLLGHSGYGLIRGITVRHRAEVVDRAMKAGLKLLGCGLPGEEARIRLLFLAGVLTREIEEFARVMDEVLGSF